MYNNIFFGPFSKKKLSDVMNSNDKFTPIVEDEQSAFGLEYVALKQQQQQQQQPGTQSEIVNTIGQTIRTADYKQILGKIEETVFGILRDVTDGKKKSVVDIFYNKDRVEGIAYLLITVGALGILIRGLRD